MRNQLSKVRADNDAAIREEVEERTARHRELTAKVRVFEEQSGINISHPYSMTPGGARLIKAMLAAGYSDTYRGLAELASRLAKAAEGIGTHLAEFDALAPADKGEDAA